MSDKPTIMRVLILDRDTSHMARIAMAAKRRWGDIGDFSTDFNDRDWHVYEGVFVGEGFYQELKGNPPISPPKKEIIVYDKLVMGHMTQKLLQGFFPEATVTKVAYQDID